ncbi:LysR family transcriptional regulator [Bordetella genomosp. 1]|uniref:LysR family transcriptional regulator n=1 Tax=Bordetella genomosp. 1 TaxID=1395607 RepID=A0ABX4F5B4_9BORD|nr:LysR family transcriptional regulator [Bordetella genomosp. 1]MDQ8030883.1 LysR family transcriptional regulator [Bordetella sp.]OZI68506.1 LysR family transcriptional regulator [Bordetella genomosp. 1]
MDLDLLHSFVSVVDAGGFTRAGERVHRTQSTVSQQIRKLEQNLGCALFVRDGRQVRLTEDGERLLGYARRMLALSTEIRVAVSGQQRAEVVRLGVPDDFAVAALTSQVAAFARAHPEARLSVRCDLSVALARALDRGDLDVALVKRDPQGGPCVAAWPERLHWMHGEHGAHAALADPVPLVVFPQGCLYRNRAIHALESAGLRWRISYESPNLHGIQAALEGGMGVALLEVRCQTAGLRRDERLPAPAPSELALCTGREAGPAALALAQRIRQFCEDDLGWTPLRQVA